MSGIIETSSGKAGRREWIGLAVIALPCVLYSMDLTVLNLAIPALTADLAPTASQMLWIMDIYGFMVAGFLITMGTLGDRIGRRRLLLMGAAFFGIASVLAAFSNSAEMLIATRALLGIAGATIAPSTLSLIRNMFHDEKERTFAIAVWATGYSVGAVIGPVLGGVMLHFFWWGSVFLLGLPVMLLLLVVGPRLLPEFRDPAAGRLDIRSAAMSLTAVLLVIYGLKRIAEHGFAVGAAATTVAGIVMGVWFARRQVTLADPLIDLRLFRSPAFSAAIATNLLSVFVAFGSFLFVAQYLQLVLGLSPLHAGLWTLPSSAGFVAGSMVAPALTGRFKRVYLMATGLALGAIGIAMFTQIDGANPLFILVTGSLINSIGIAVVVTLTTDVVVSSATPERAGAAAALSETGAELGGALGIALIGSAGAAMYRRAMSGAMPAGVTAEDVVAARSTIGGATAVAERIGGTAGDHILETARASFTASLQLTGLIGAIVLTATAIMILIVLRRAAPVQSQP